MGLLKKIGKVVSAPIRAVERNITAPLAKVTAGIPVIGTVAKGLDAANLASAKIGSFSISGIDKDIGNVGKGVATAAAAYFGGPLGGVAADLAVNKKFSQLGALAASATPMALEGISAQTGLDLSPFQSFLPGGGGGSGKQAGSPQEVTGLNQDYGEDRARLPVNYLPLPQSDNSIYLIAGGILLVGVLFLYRRK